MFPFQSVTFNNEGSESTVLRGIMGSLCLHWKDKIPKFGNKISQKRNIGISVPISTFKRLWAIYLFPRSVSLFYWRKYVDHSWDYINRSQTHECWNWGWGRAILRKGIHKGDFRCSVQLPLSRINQMFDDQEWIFTSGFFHQSGLRGIVSMRFAINFSL